jgi:dipeptidyl aminopeptidase/acylaminoacyl peptidase
MRFLPGLIVAIVAWAQVPDAKQALSMQRILEAKISPDGSAVAYVLTRTNWEDNANETELYLASIASGERVKLSGTRKAATSPEWSPDGKRLAFLSEVGGKSQVFALPMGGGEAVQVTDHGTSVGGYQWWGNDRIVFTAADEESAAAKDTKKKYGNFTVVEQDYTMSHVWLVRVTEADKQKAERLTEGDFTVTGVATVPDGKTLVITTKKNPDLSTLGARMEVVTVGEKTRRLLAETKTSFGQLRVSPDGKSVVYSTPGEVEYSYYVNGNLEVRPIAGGTPVKVNGGVDEVPQIVEWTGRGILFLARDKTAMRVFLGDPSGGEARELRIPDRWMMNGVSLSREGTVAAFIGAQPNEAFEVYVTPATAWQPRAVTAMKEQWKGFKPARREVIWWQSKDGATIEGVLYKPVDFDATKKYPLLVVIHGGPTGIDLPYLQPDSYYPAEQFVAKGALVLRPNYRGSAGYGAAFRALNVGNLGVGDAWDVLSGIDSLVSKGMVDPARVGAMGWSQGGYIAAFLATAHADRFKALSVGAGISNWVTYYVNTDIHPFTRQYLKATPWQDMEVYKKTSPMTYINQAKAPVLIQHGDNDKRVPPPNAFELYQGLKDVGVPARLVLYKGFGHGINKPKEAMHVMEENLRWFSRYVFGETAN